MARRGNVNGPTPSEFSFGRGSRPSMDLYPQPDEKLDPLALKRAQLQTDTTDPQAPLDFTGEHQAYDEYGRPLATLQERGFTPIVRETGRGEMDDRLDPTNPKLYEDRECKGADPNESWYDRNVHDPIRRGWENENYDQDVNAKTAAYKQGADPEQQWNSNMVSELTGKRRKIKRTPPSRHPLYKNGEVDPRELHGD